MIADDRKIRGSVHYSLAFVGLAIMPFSLQLGFGIAITACAARLLELWTAP